MPLRLKVFVGLAVGGWPRWLGLTPFLLAIIGLEFFVVLRRFSGRADYFFSGRVEIAPVTRIVIGAEATPVFSPSR